jgi:hypothetical protein
VKNFSDRADDEEPARSNEQSCSEAELIAIAAFARDEMLKKLDAWRNRETRIRRFDASERRTAGLSLRTSGAAVPAAYARG